MNGFCIQAEVLYNLLIFNQRIIAFQCCVSFCHASAWISSRYTYVPSLVTSLPPPTPSDPSWLSQGPGMSTFQHTANPHYRSSLHMVVYLFQYDPQFIPHCPSPTVFTDLFSMPASPLLACKWFHQLLMLINMWYLFLLDRSLEWWAKMVSKKIAMRFLMGQIARGFREGNGTPLQCSCLENPMDGGAWWAAVYGVAQSWTWLKRLSSSKSFVRISMAVVV